MTYGNTGRWSVGNSLPASYIGHQLHSDFQSPPEVLLFSAILTLFFLFIIHILHCQLDSYSRPDTQVYFVARCTSAAVVRCLSDCLAGWLTGWLSRSSKRLKIRPSLLWNANRKLHPSFPVVGPYHFYIHLYTLSDF